MPDATQRHPLATSPNRVMLAGDWHGDTEHARSAIGWAARQGAEGILQLGDFGIWPGVGGRRYLDALDATLGSQGLWLGFVDGNHEDFWQLLQLPVDRHGARRVRPRIWHLPRGLRWSWHGRTWLALGGATSLDRPRRRLGVEWWPEEEITFRDAQAATSGGRADFMLTHDCPAGVDIPDLPPASTWAPAELNRANAHRQVLRAVVHEVRPQRLFHGHFHVRHDAVLRGEGYETAITGLNDNQGPFPQNVLMLDLMTMSEELQ